MVMAYYYTINGCQIPNNWGKCIAQKSSGLNINSISCCTSQLCLKAKRTLYGPIVKPQPECSHSTPVLLVPAVCPCC